LALAAYFICQYAHRIELTVVGFVHQVRDHVIGLAVDLLFAGAVEM